MHKSWMKKYGLHLSGALVISFCILAGVGFYNVYKPLPRGLSFAGHESPVTEINFYKDLTWVDDVGNRHSQQEIFDRVIRMIGEARELIVLDMFLFNPDTQFLGSACF